jgi:hypothetical protein
LVDGNEDVVRTEVIATADASEGDAMGRSSGGVQYVDQSRPYLKPTTNIRFNRAGKAAAHIEVPRCTSLVVMMFIFDSRYLDTSKMSTAPMRCTVMSLVACVVRGYTVPCCE